MRRLRNRSPRQDLTFVVATLFIGLVGLVGLAAPGPALARPRGRRVTKKGPNVARQSLLRALRPRIIEDLGSQRIFDHVRHTARRQASVAFAKAHGSPKHLDLAKLIPNAPPKLRQRTETILARIATRPSAVWLRDLSREFQGQHDKALKNALTTCAAEIERLGTIGRPKNWEKKAQKRYETHLAHMLLRRNGSHTAWLLGQRKLPSFPTTKDAGVRAELKRVAPLKTRARQIARLEETAAILVGSALPTDRRRGKALRGYLAKYKRGTWARALVDARLGTYAKETDLPWTLTDKVAWKHGVNKADQRAMTLRLKKAWTILHGVVHPDLLAWLPALRIDVDPQALGASHHADIITLRSDSSVADILHEVGHHIEDYGGLRTIAGAHAILSRRAHDGAPKSLRDLDPTATHAPADKAFAGAFLHPYMGKTYADGATEILSMGLERLATPQKALRFFLRDGDHFLQVLNAVQRKPWPLVD
ncbi:MAG: hypothetical protein KAI47_01550 [Deltaproteobacteria bacterium]|nr:hypothetical protein [Deltaproteobacteria bacterium]